tara:strand:- start:211 stop:1314 length:1104 start_codon:yes stop_codon:yes gene_type:complete
MKLAAIVLAIITGSACSNEDATHFHLHSERSKKAEYVKYAFGSLPGGHSKNLAWPFQVDSIAHTIGSYQLYPGVKPYFHHGIDLRQDSGTAVYSSTPAKVVNIENYILGNDLYWEVALLDQDGFIWQYHHIEKQSIPKSIYSALKNGKIIPEGTLLGEIVKWPVFSLGERFDHIHLNILDKDAEYVNPLLFMESLHDQTAPVIEGITLLDKNPDTRSARDRIRDAFKHGVPKPGQTAPETLLASGDYSIGVKVYDLINHDVFKVPPYKVSYRINGGKENTFWKFDKIPGGSDIRAYPEKFYVRNKTCGDYHCKRMTMNLEFSLKRTPSQELFPKELGTHEIEINAIDFHGNSSTRTFIFEVVAKDKK